MARRSRGGPISYLISWAIVAAFLALIIGAFVLFAREQQDQASHDQRTSCRHDGEYNRTAILIDAGDPLREDQIKGVREYIEDKICRRRKKDGEIVCYGLRLDLEPQEWVGMYVLDEHNAVFPPDPIVRCDLRGVEQANPLYDDREKIRRQLIERLRPMVEKVEGLTKENIDEQSTSPILDMVRAVATHREYRSSGRRRLVIVSDMLQDTPEYSHRLEWPEFDSFRANPYARDFLDRSLLDVEVTILYMTRDEKLQTEEYQQSHKVFWRKYFTGLGTSGGSIIPIP